MSFSMSGGAFSHNRFDKFEEALLEAKGYQEGGEVKGCEGDCKKDCDECDKKKSAKKGKKSSGAKPDFLDVDKDGNKEEDMKDAIEDNGGAVSEEVVAEESGAELQARLIAGHKQKRAPKKGTKAHAKYWDKEEAAMKKEELEATGLFTAEELQQIDEVLGLGKKLSPEAKAKKDREKKLKEAERIAKQLAHPFSDVANTGKVRRATLKKEGFSDEEIQELEEKLSIDDQMRIAREAAKDRNPNPDHKAIRAKQIKNSKAPKDTRTDDEKMTDATGPRPGSRYRGD